jgi:hypothetical protein
MLMRVLFIALLVVFSFEFEVGIHAQVSPAQQSSMLKPPPVSGQSYRVETGMEERENYISGGIGAGAGYIDNLNPGSGTGQLSEGIISLQPTIAFDATSARQHMSATYSPSFLFYEPSSVLDEADHNAFFKFEYRFSPRITMDLSDLLVRSSSGFIQIGNGGISGSGPTTTGVLVPFGTRFSNEANGGLSYQVSPHSMIGGSGVVGKLNYSDSSQTAGLYDSDYHGGSGFYNYRVSASQYLGAIYTYEEISAYSQIGQYDTQTHTIDGFYTIYLTETFSLSVAGGPQHYASEYAPNPATRAWTPAVTASMGWQAPHSSFAASFSRTVTGGGGLIGTFNSINAAAIGRWQFSRLWNTSLNVNYTDNKNNTPVLGLTSPAGHTFVTSLSLGRALSTHTDATLRYDRIQNRYDGVPSIATNPSSDRIMLSFNWRFERPVGR